MAQEARERQEVLKRAQELQRLKEQDEAQVCPSGVSDEIEKYGGSAMLVRLVVVRRFLSQG